MLVISRPPLIDPATDSSCTVQRTEQPQTYKDSTVSSRFTTLWSISLFLLLALLLTPGCSEESAEAETRDLPHPEGSLQQISSTQGKDNRDTPRGPGHRAESPPPGLDTAELHDTLTTTTVVETDAAVITTGENEITPPLLLPPLDYHRGVNYADIWSSTTGYGSEASARQHRRLRSIGVNAIAVTPFGFQEGASSNGLVGFTRDGPVASKWDRTEEFGREVSLAKKSGLRVMMKPHIWSHDFWGGGEWHGTVRQNSAEDHKTWWASYRRFNPPLRSLLSPTWRRRAMYWHGAGEDVHRVS